MRAWLLCLLLLGGLANLTLAPAAEATVATPQRAAININTATAAELDAGLHLIGPNRAQRIIAYRRAHGPFREPEQIMEVPYIGRRIYEANRAAIRVD